MTSKHIEQARRALAAVDVSSHVASITEASAEQQRIAEAIEAGREQLTAIGYQIREAKEGSATDPVIAADALLAGEAPPSVDIDALYAKKAAVEAGMNDLRRREQGLGEVQRRERSDAINVIANAAEPLSAEVIELAQQAAKLLASAYASAEAIRMATSNVSASHTSEKLRKIVQTCVDAGFLSAAAIPVPDEIVHTLRAGEDQINALRLAIPTEIRTFAPRVSPPIAAEPRREPGPSKSPDRVGWLS